MEARNRKARNLDYQLIVVLLLIGAFGCLAVLAATHGKTNSAIPKQAWLKQAMFDVIGLTAMGFTAYFDYRSLRKLRWWFYGITVFLLIAVFGFSSVSGAHSWIPLGVLSLQPSEFAKLALIIATASWMADIDEEEFPDYSIRRTWPIWAMLIVPFALTMKEPALGQALVMFAISITMYVVFCRKSQFIWLTVAFVVVVVGLGVVEVQFPTQSTVAVNWLVKHHVLQPYQAGRILTWLDPNYDIMHSGWNIHQAEIAVGSGQLFGEGLFSGVETRGGFVPNQWTDYIFSAIGEEFGFIGSAILILLFLILIYRLVKIASNAQDTFGTYLVVGIIAMFGFQVFENIGANMYMSPSTGITLPFISYGGSSLVANYIAIGIALSVSFRKKKLSFS